MSELILRVAAQAKLNLALRVLAREASGYHQLETVFARIDLADDVTIQVHGRGRAIDVRNAEVGPAERNLAWRAAVAFMERTGWPGGFRIEIDKRIPVGAGLGGGSADAAAVLRALNSVAPNPLPQNELLRIAFALGADVPFLATDLSLALAWGRGERMMPLPTPAPRTVHLLVPDFPVATADAFAWLAAARESGESRQVGPEVLAEAPGSWSSIAGMHGNDFEQPVRRRHPRLGEVIDALRAAYGTHAAGMTGSGSALWVMAEDTGSVAMPLSWRVLRANAPSPVSAPERA